jgi:hypothetical protein
MSDGRGSEVENSGVMITIDSDKEALRSFESFEGTLMAEEETVL